ncbi:hypothetical protein CDAR_171831 [Caerostris darwini]|uniref:Uncharacterized protein n=1 Tax=Caerostris darwini TaxID=1538125 RepID=A0AAV4MMQ0_9ARAC|nr:hypothetical protein CDAR_171831 [Caerostris darwini]
MTSPNEESPHISVTQLPGLQQLSPPQLYLLPWTTTAKICPDAFTVNRFPNQTSPCASGPKQLRFHFAKVAINSAFRKHSSEWAMQNDMHFHGT